MTGASFSSQSDTFLGASSTVGDCWINNPCTWTKFTKFCFFTHEYSLPWTGVTVTTNIRICQEADGWNEWVFLCWPQRKDERTRPLCTGTCTTSVHAAMKIITNELLVHHFTKLSNRWLCIRPLTRNYMCWFPHTPHPIPPRYWQHFISAALCLLTFPWGP